MKMRTRCSLTFCRAIRITPTRCKVSRKSRCSFRSRRKRWDTIRASLEHGEPSSDILYNCGVLSQQLGEPNHAINFYEAALEKEPNFAEALLNLGHALEASGSNDRARDCWIRALDLKPELACGYFAPRVDSSAQAEVRA